MALLRGFIDDSEMKKSEAGPPIACDFTPAAIRAGRAGLLPGLADLADKLERTADGYRLTFNASSDMLRAIADTIDAERQCCRWLRFDLSVAPSYGPIELTLTGPEGGPDFLSALFEQ